MINVSVSWQMKHREHKDDKSKCITLKTKITNGIAQAEVDCHKFYAFHIYIYFISP